MAWLHFTALTLSLSNTQALRVSNTVLRAPLSFTAIVTLWFCLTVSVYHVYSENHSSPQCTTVASLQSTGRHADTTTTDLSHIHSCHHYSTTTDWLLCSALITAPRFSIVWETLPSRPFYKTLEHGAGGKETLNYSCLLLMAKRGRKKQKREKNSWRLTVSQLREKLQMGGGREHGRERDRYHYIF
jgi:hypothetical protein